MTTPLIGAYNFRDVGGALIRHNTLFRSDTLQALTTADKNLLTDRLGIRCVLDLRAPVETAAEGRAELPGLCYVNIPLQSVHSGQSKRLDEIYADHLTHDTNLPIAIEVLSTLLPRPTVVHCASGKDRTGIVTAIALGLAGAERDTIVQDYLRSADNMPRVIERFRHLRLPDELFRCTESTIGTFLDTLDNEFGGFTGWAQRAGVSNDTIHRLRQTLSQRPGRRPDS